jgi:hypothetical protein
MLKIRSLIACALILSTSTSTIAQNQDKSLITHLMETPASQYDLGLFKMTLTASQLTSQLKGEFIKNTMFEIDRVGVITDIDSTDFMITLKGDAREMSEESCKSVREVVVKSQSLSFIKSSSFFKGVPIERLEELNNFVRIIIQLVSRENQSFKIEC